MYNLYTRYTKTFRDFLVDNPDFLNDVIDDFIDLDHKEKLISHIKAKYNYYEIGGETDSEFYMFMKDTFDEYKDYYIQMISGYEDNISVMDLIKKEYTLTTQGDVSTDEQGTETTTNTGTNTREENINGSITNSGNTTTSTNGDDTTLTTDIDLPNKNTNNEYPTSKTREQRTPNLTTTVTPNTTEGRISNNIYTDTPNLTSTRTPNLQKVVNTDMIRKLIEHDYKNYVNLKNSYLKQVRDLYEEFSNRFKECFVLIFN